MRKVNAPISNNQKWSMQLPVPPGHVHTGVVRGLGSVARELGGDLDAIAAAAGVDLSRFGTHGGTISLKDLGEVLEAGRTRLRCPHLGLLVGARAGVASLGIVGEYMAACGTIGEALQGLEDHLSVQNRGAICSIRRWRDVTLLSFTPYDPDMTGVEMVAEGGLAAAVGAIRNLLDPGWAPIEVLLPRRPPEDPAPYGDVFRAPVRYNQEIAALVIPTAMMGLPLRSADPAARRAIAERLAHLEARGQKVTIDDVRRAMRARLLTGGCSATEIAHQFGINRRTLNRHLGDAGTSFRAVYDAVRFQAARHLVGDTDMPLAQISDILHFSEPPAFTRAFERWSGGVCPSGWRARITTEQTAP